MNIPKHHGKFLYERNINNKRLRIRAFVDDYVVYCQWFKRKHMWRYCIEKLYIVSLYFANRKIKKI